MSEQTKAPARGQAKTDKERKRLQREREKEQGIIPYSCKIHKDDKQKLDDFVKRLNSERGF